ncbi:hypothetical protein LTS18_009744, partial [Coniosporium uncinatum]
PSPASQISASIPNPAPQPPPPSVLGAAPPATTAAASVPKQPEPARPEAEALTPPGAPSPAMPEAALQRKRSVSANAVQGEEAKRAKMEE